MLSATSSDMSVAAESHSEKRGQPSNEAHEDTAGWGGGVRTNK